MRRGGAIQTSENKLDPPRISGITVAAERFAELFTIMRILRLLRESYGITVHDTASAGS